MNCPKCHKALTAGEINIQKDIAHCITCNHVFSISQHISPTVENLEKPEDFDIGSPPEGAWFKQQNDKVVFGASSRSKVAFYLIPFMLIWSGVSIGGIYGFQIKEGKFDIISSLFGLPFLAVTIFFLFVIIRSIGGKVEITLDNSGGKIFTGVGKIGKTQEFLWDKVVQVIDKPSKLNYPGGGAKILSIEGQNRINFANSLKEEKRNYLYFTMLHFMDQYNRKKYII